MFGFSDNVHIDADYVPSDVLNNVRKIARACGARVETKKDKRGCAVRVFTRMRDSAKFREALQGYTSSRIIW